MSKIQKMYHLTPVQEGMLFHSLLHPDGQHYYEQACFHLKGNIQLDVLEKAWKEVMQRHEMMRTDFLWKKIKVPVQVILAEKDVEIALEDLTHLETDDQNDFITEIKERGLSRLNLEQNKVNYMTFLRLGNESGYICWTFHHILLDGWSVSVILQDFLAVYHALATGRLLLARPVAQFSKYLDWMKGRNQKKALDFWQQMMDHLEEPTLLNDREDLNKPKIVNYVHEFEQASAKSVQDFCREQNITLNTLIQTSWGILLQKYNNTEISCSGITVSGRPVEIKNVDQIAGIMINTLPVVIHTTGEETVKELLSRTNTDLIEIQDYGYVSLPEIQKLSHLKLDQRLFDTLISVENHPSSGIQLKNDSVSLAFDTGFEVTNFDFVMQAKGGNGLTLNVAYNANTFSEEAIQCILAHYSQLIHSIIKAPESRIVDLSMLSKVERDRLIFEFNQTKTAFPREKTLSELFEDQVKKNPSQIALVFKDQQLTYSKLNQRVNQLARRLREKGVQKGQIVGIMVERSFEMLIGLLAIIKAGGAYLPINPKDPIDRIQFLLEDSQTSLLLIQPHLQEKVEFAGEIIDLTDPSLFQGDSSNLAQINTSEDLAYVIYTSGTTGRPKGTLTSHNNISRVVKNTNYIEINSTDRILQLSNYAFDGSTFDIFGALLNNATLVLVEQEMVLEPQKIAGLIEEEKISILFVTTALFNTLIDVKLDCLTGVRKILFGGERVSVPHVQKAFQKLGEDKIIHVYGPTESTVYATYYPVNEISKDAENVPIGRPLANTKIFVVDQNQKLQPIGVPGEIWVAGDGLARCYLNQPDMTAKAFLANPFANESDGCDQRVYRTGDLARWLPDGNLEFLGRVDQQVKIRGYRIEPGEIVQVLLDHPLVQEGLVLAREDRPGERYLCAYLVTDLSQMELAGEMKSYLGAKLPEYMIPTYFISIRQLPLTANGKIDKKVLPAPENIESFTEYLPPRNDVEAKLTKIWSEVFGIERIGIIDNFFDLGGHSLSAIQIISRILKDLNQEVPLRKIFESPTIQELADYIIHGERNHYSAITPIPEADVYPVSSAQKRLYAIWELAGESITYNIPMIWRIKGVLNRYNLKTAFQALVSRHESLRTSFTVEDGVVVQKVHPEIQLDIIDLSVGSGLIEKIIEGFVQPFDLKIAPLFRVGLAELQEESILIMDVHHIVADGTTMDILIKDFVQLYEGETLEPLQIHYKDYANWSNQYLQSDQIREQQNYWFDRFKGEIPQLNLMTDFPRLGVMDHQGDSFNCKIEATLAEKLRELAVKEGATLQMTLLASLNVLLSKTANQDEILIGTPIAGRNHPDLEKIAGMFVNNLVMQNRPSGDKIFVEFLKEVKENSLKAYENQDYPFEMLVEYLDIKRDLSRNPLFDVMFALQNTVDLQFEADGLTFEPVQYSFKRAKFDLTIHAFESEEGILFDWVYSKTLFKTETIERMAKHFIQLLKELVQNPDSHLSTVEMVTAEEKEQILEQFNDTKVKYPDNATMQQLFEQQVERTPDQTAVVFEESQLTYRELNQRANQLARVLRERGVRPEQTVGIMAKPSLEMMVGVLAIIKAGGAYLPIDLDYPAHRIEFMLQDANVKLLLADGLNDLELVFGGEIINLEDKVLYLGDSSNLENLNHPEDLIYIIYTSGSTGQPKGVMVEHRNVNRLVSNSDLLDITSNHRILQTGSLAFDASTYEIWGALTHGATLYLLSKGVLLSVDQLEERMKEYGITMMFLTTPLFNQLCEENPNIFTPLKMLMVGGDTLSCKHINLIRSRFKDLQVTNVYGPTEGTTFTTYYHINQDFDMNIPIGKPLTNTQIYILGHSGQLQPVGVPGELCIGGDGVTRGYLNRIDLTQEKFVDHPTIGERLYRSGDLARWLPDGNIEFLGRIDHQVKVRGFRIELGEVEYHLRQYPGITEAAVIVQKDMNGVKYICSYLVGQQNLDHGIEVSLSTGNLRSYLLERLPEYMIPSYFVELDQLPLTPGGKLDKNALPETIGVVNTGVAYEAPTNDTEGRLVKIWSQILGIEMIGVHDSFFDLGGNSIKLITLGNLVNKEFQTQLRTVELFHLTTIREISQQIDGSTLDQEDHEAEDELMFEYSL